MSILSYLTYLCINLIVLQALCLAQLVYLNPYAGYLMAIALITLGVASLSHGFFYGGLTLIAESAYACINLVLALAIIKTPMLISLPMGWLLFIYFFLKGGSLVFWGTIWNNMDNGILIVASGLVSIGIGIFLISYWPEVNTITYYRSLALCFLAELFAFSVIRNDLKIT